MVNGAFNNLTLQESGGSLAGTFSAGDDGPITSTSLDVNGNLTLTSSAELVMNNDDLLVAGNFVVESGTTFTPGTNTLTFDGSGDQAFTMTGTITSLNNVTMNKSGGTLTPSAAMTVGGSLSLTAGTFADNGLAHTVSGNVTNSATHSGSGSISLNGTATQTIGGDGTGIFQNLTLFNTNAAAAPISSTAAITVNGVLTFSNDKIFSIADNLLTFGASASTSGSGSARYIQTSGSLSDGGITKTYGTTGSFTWPIGATDGTVYTPATINVVTATTTGDINIKPISSEHPNVTSTGHSLTYYWSVSTSGFSGISSVTHTYNYADSDIQGTETEYIFGRFDSSTNSWTTGVVGDVDEGTNTIGGSGNLSGVDYISGDFTAGDADPATPFGSVTVFFSRNTAPNITTTGADWDTDSSGDKTTWATGSHGGDVATQLPEDVQGSRVVIADGHIVNVSTNSKTVDGIEITGTLDLGSTTSHDFGVMSGTGNMIITSSGGSPVFPSGDGTSFLGSSGGTVTYTNAGLFIQNLPSTPTTYNNLTINGGITGGGSFGTTLPAVDIEILNDLTISDGASAGNTANVFFSNGVTYTVGNDLILSSQNSQSVVFQFGDGSATSLVVGNDITVGSSTTFQVDDSNGANDHTISVGGSIVNNGTFGYGTYFR